MTFPRDDGLVHLNVRCCCNSDKIYGTLGVQPEFCHVGYIFLAPKIGRDEKVTDFNPQDRVVPLKRPERVKIRLETLSSPGRSKELAVYSDDHPLEFWKQFPTFTPAE